MFGNYYYNKNLDSNGNHEVHHQNCSWMPKEHNKVLIGFSLDCDQAIRDVKAKTGKTNFDGCYHCCPKCHKG